LFQILRLFRLLCLPCSALLLWGLAVNSSQAGQKLAIYHAEALVKNASEGERNMAARATLGEVVVRVTGQTAALEHPQIRAALGNAQQYLFGFSYQASNDKLVRDGKAMNGVKLLLEYSPEAIEQLLREAQLPLWPATRPKVLVWLVAKDHSGFHLVPELADAKALFARAQQRGVPVVRPAMDLEDSLSIAADDLWNLDLDKIRAASLRYKVDAVLVGRYALSELGDVIPLEPLALSAEQESTLAPLPELPTEQLAVDNAAPASDPVPQGPWQSDWQLLLAADSRQFAEEAPQVSDLLQSAVDSMADYFAGVYAITPNNQGPQTLVVNIGNVANFGAFKEAQAYINELAMVRKSDFVRVSGDQLWLNLTIEGDIRLFMETLALGRRLAPIATESISSLTTSAVQAGEQAQAGTELLTVDASVEASINAELAREFGVEPGAIAARAGGAENEANQAVSAAPAFVPPQAGTAEDPLLYVWKR
jgi:uncharacterized protein